MGPVESVLPICSNGSAPLKRWLLCPYMVKILKKNLLLQNQESFEAESLLQYSIAVSSSNKSVQMMIVG